MRTSTTQFEMLVHFMEQNGDLNKPCKDASGRLEAIKHWECLTNLLNAEPTGENKTMDKWKKVWSDLKNNTKKKAAKIDRAACETGGPTTLKLTNLEERILNISGRRRRFARFATDSVSMEEASLSQEPKVIAYEDSQRIITLTPTTPPVILTSIPDTPPIFDAPDDNFKITVVGAWNQSTASHETLISPVPAQSSLSPSLSPVHSPLFATIEEQDEVPPSLLSTASCNPDPRGHTTQRRHSTTGRRNLSSPRRYQHSAKQFLKANVKWRTFVRKQHEDNREIELEKLRLKKKELQSQARWQDISMLAIAALNKLLDKKFQTQKE